MAIKLWGEQFKVVEQKFVDVKEALGEHAEHPEGIRIAKLNEVLGHANALMCEVRDFTKGLLEASRRAAEFDARVGRDEDGTTMQLFGGTNEVAVDEDEEPTTEKSKKGRSVSG